MSDDNNMHDDPLNRLKDAATPDPRAEARQRALAAGMAAFDAARKESRVTPQGNPWGQRLTSIITSWKGKSIMDLRLPIGTAAIALIVLPLGYQLYSSTSMTPADVPVTQQVVIDQTPVADQPVTAHPGSLNDRQAGVGFVSGGPWGRWVRLRGRG